MQTLLSASAAVAVSAFLAGQHYESHKIPMLYTRTAPSVVYIESIGSMRNPIDVVGERQMVMKGIGSGFAVKKVSPKKTQVVTNYHVVSDSEKIKVILDGADDEDGLDAKLIAADIKNDLALLEIDVSVPPLKFCTSDIDIGESVVAIGSPFGLEQSISQGIVSGSERQLDIFAPANLIQTDTAINPGNSGGPLLRVSDGCVLGVNTATIGSASSIGFAVPVDKIKDIVATNIVTTNINS